MRSSAEQFLQVVVYLQGAVLGQVGHVDCVADAVLAESGSERVFSQGPRDLRVVGPDHRTEDLDALFLSQLHGDAGPFGHVLDYFSDFGQHPFVGLEKLNVGLFVRPQHLQAGQFEAGLEQEVYNLARLALGQYVRLYQAKRAVGEHGAVLNRAAENEGEFAGGGLRGVAAVNRVLGAVDPEPGADRVRGFFLGDEGVGGADEGAPLLDSVLADEFHADAEVAGHEGDEGLEEGLAAVLCVEGLGLLAGEAEHLDVGEGEGRSLDCGNDGPDGEVGVGLDHAVGPLEKRLHFFARELVPVAHHPKLFGVDGEDVAGVEVLEPHLRGRPPQELGLPVRLQQVGGLHDLDGGVEGEEVQTVLAHDCGLGVVPLDLEAVPLFAHIIKGWPT